MDLHNIREDYSKRELSESECRADPIVQFEQWLNEAIHSQVNEPTAVKRGFRGRRRQAEQPHGAAERGQSAGICVFQQLLKPQRPLV